MMIGISSSWTIVCFLWGILAIVQGDSLHPVRFPNEEEFFRAKTHERSMTVAEMESKIKTVRERRKFQPWNPQHPHVKQLLSGYNTTSINGRRRPNILLMLADDLGYGDLSVEPFTLDPDKRFPCGEGGHLSRNLERMASQGVIMTNFHSAAPVCSPARAAIMTGLYSWRMTAMNAFELGRDMSQRNGFLPQIPTIPEIFREQGYYTAHSGKWHLGGMREEQRRDRVYHDKCARPSPNQHGFEEYISELDGPESPRYTFLLQTLHTLGHHHLLKDDVPVPIIEKPNVQNVLSDREAGDAVEFIREQHKQFPEQPWFVQVWFNAPHHPWELLQSGEEIFGKEHHQTPEEYAKAICPWDKVNYPLREQQSWKYKTMVAAMDKSIGNLLDVIHELQLEEDTLILFTSDNGNEDGSGSGGLFKEGKRSLMEGGVRVPMIMQWKNVIPAGSYSSYFGGHTDLLPTFLEAASIPRPAHLHFDGVSLLPILRQAPPAPKNRRDLRDRHYHVPVNVPGDEIIRERLWRRYQDDAYLQYHVNLTFGFPTHDLATDDKDAGAVRWTARLPPSPSPPHHHHHHHHHRRQLSLAQAGNKAPATSTRAATTAHGTGRSGHHIMHGVHSAHGRDKSPDKNVVPDSHVNVSSSSSSPPASMDSVVGRPSTPSMLHQQQQQLQQQHHHVPTSELEYLVSSRVFLWHKETDPYRSRDERMGSAGYFDQIKVIAQGRRGCIEKIFDLKHDPFEDRNLLASPYNHHAMCKLSIYDVDGAALKNALLSNHDLPLPDHCKTAAAMQESCSDKYLSMVVFKSMVVVRKLVPFMRDGNRGHQWYMSEDADKAVCDVPVASHVKQMDYLRDTNCERHKFGCSFPEY